MGQRKSLIEYEHGKCAAGLAGIHPICKMEFCSNHCLVALDLVANVEQPFYSHRPERQAMQSVGRSIDWTLEDMVDGLFFCATLTGSRGGHTPFVQAGAETFDTGAEAVSRPQALLGRVIQARCQCRV